VWKTQENTTMDSFNGYMLEIPIALYEEIHEIALAVS
jgi:hypothetical protein